MDIIVPILCKIYFRVYFSGRKFC